MQSTFDRVDAVLAVARALLPVREAAPNRGRFVDAIIEAAGGRPPEPWCASFVYYCGHAVMGRDWPLPMTRSCDVLLDFGRKHNLLRNVPEIGDIFLVMKSSVDAVHTGFVVAELDSEDGLSPFETLEGNTNTDGSSNGIGVFSLTRGRTPRTVYEFLRWSDLLSPRI